MSRKILTASALALTALLPLVPAHAAQPGTVIVQPDRGYHATQTYQVIPAPPPPRREAVPRPRRGQVWEQGHWEWRGDRYRWVQGHWVQARQGHRYHQPQWVQRDGRWELERGRWYRDTDGDGIANRYDRDRDGDGISNRNDRDRDGDGIPNRRDNHPDNARRN